GAGGARSVTVVAPAGIAADAWSTAFFVLGCDRALALAAGLRGLDVVCVDSGVRWSAGLDGRVALATASSYRADSAARGTGRAPVRARAPGSPGSRHRSSDPDSSR
ncbi:MAG: FAD:protein FMN transferase, partial [Gemmatimonadetes bacterium]|nr:FAD:protein FMN transferase [Gemmatimonadota bacterium]